MAHKRKGRKIYTYRVRNRKMFSKSHPMRSALGVFLTLVLAAFAGVVGYSIAAPITERLAAEAESPTTVPPETTTVTTETTTAPASTSSAQSTSEVTTATTTAATAVTVPPRFDEPVQLIYCASEETVTDADLLEITVESLAQQGYTAMMLPLKTAGGTLLYRSGVEAAQVSGASAEDLPALAALSDTISQRGLSAMALFDTLNDQAYPSAYTNGAYTIADSGQRWLDTKVENGGKPWLSPFTEYGRSYLAQLAAEITEAGFSRLFCHDFIFPTFRDSDVSYIGSFVRSEERRAEALGDVITAISDAAAGTVYAYTEGEELQIADLPEGVTVYMKLTPSSSENALAQLQAAQSLAGEKAVIPWVIRGTLNDTALDEILHALYDAGCREMVVSAE